MNCPKCGKQVSPGQTVCEHCGASIPAEDIDLVFSERDMPRSKRKPFNKIAVIVLCVLIVIGGGVFAFWYLNKDNNRGSNTSNEAASTLDSAAATEKETVAAQPATAPSAAPAKPEKDPNEQKLEAYIKDSTLREDLLSLADGEMTLNALYAEKNLIIVRYQIPYSQSDTEQTEYLETIPGTISEICSRLDEDLFDLRRKTGVENAAIEIICVDNSGSTIYSDTV